MTILFMGAERDAFTSASSAAIESTTAGRFNATYARCSFQVADAGTTNYTETPAFATQTGTIWVHWDNWIENFSGVGAGHKLITLVNTSGTDVFQILTTGGGTVKAQYWNGSAWVDTGSTFTLSASTLQNLDLKVVCGGSGSFEFWHGVDGADAAMRLSGSASMTSVTNINMVRLWSCAAFVTSGQRVSQVIIADEDTKGMKLHTKPPTGNGANTAFTGAFGDVDEAVLSQTDYIQSTAANDVETFTGAALTLTGRTVKAVGVSMQVKHDGLAPTNVQAALRIGGTNYFSSNLSPTTAYGPAVTVWNTDPSTAAAWGITNAGSATTEFGVKSIT